MDKYIKDQNDKNVMRFHNIKLSDLPLFKDYFTRYPTKRCVYNTANLFLWGNFYPTIWTEYKGRLIIYNGARECILKPVGEDFSAKELFDLSNMFRKNGYCGNYAYIEEDYVKNNPELKKNFYLIVDEKTADYLYLTDDLITLRGKKLAKKKNLISQFKRNYDKYYVEPIKPENKHLCVKLSKKWSKYKESALDSASVLKMKDTEMQIFNKGIDYFEELNLEGLMISVDGDNNTKEMIAFSVFEEQDQETAVVHFEKSDPDIKGSAQIINYETAVWLQKKYKYINREDDMGILQLRQAKRSYKPIEHLLSYRLIRRDCKKQKNEEL